MASLSDSKILRSWFLYDWANSAFSLVIISTIFPIYYGSQIRVIDPTNGLVAVFGYHIQGSALFSYTLSLSFLIIGILSPMLSGLADAWGKRRAMMQFFCLFGALFCGLLFFFSSAHIFYGLAVFALATIGFSGSIVFYNSFLPHICPPSDADSVSAKGFGWGYVGSVILLLMCLGPVLQPGWFGLSGSDSAARLAFLMTAIWWAGFGYLSIRGLPKDKKSALVNDKNLNDNNNWLAGFRELQKTWRQAIQLPVMKKYLLAFFFYSMGLQTIMYVAALFGEKELNLPASGLIATILIIQLVAIAGARVLALVSDRMGNFSALALLALVWMGACVAAYFVVNATQFYMLAVVVGLLMGGTQSLSRSTFSKLIPETSTDTASFFSFYDVSEKAAIVLGTFAYGLIEQLTGNMRASTLTLALFFGLGFVLLVGLARKGNKLKGI